MKKALFSKLFLALLLVAVDAGLKWLAVESVPSLGGIAYPFGGVGVFDAGWISFSLNTVVNTGIAWGLFPQFPSLLLGVRLCIVAALFAFLIVRSPRASLPLWLIAAGALGNIIDMLRYGWVIDYLHMRFFGWSFPIFNLADALITVGALLLLLQRRASSALDRSS